MISERTAEELRELPRGRRIGSILKEYDRATARKQVVAMCERLEVECMERDVARLVEIEAASWE